MLMDNLARSPCLHAQRNNLLHNFFFQLLGVVVRSRGLCGDWGVPHNLCFLYPLYNDTLAKSKVSCDLSSTPPFVDQLCRFSPNHRHVFVCCVWHMNHPKWLGDSKLLGYYGKVDMFAKVLCNK